MSNEISASVRKFPNTEIVDQTEFTWAITDWMALEDRSVSEPIECGGFLWQILIFPQGNPASPRKGNIALYLNALGPGELKNKRVKKDSNTGDSADSNLNDDVLSNDIVDNGINSSLAFDAAQQESWHACCAFTLTMYNPNHPSVQLAQGSNHRFTPKITDWGYSEFTTLRSAFVRPVDQPAPLIDTIPQTQSLGVNITVKMNVLADPTGILWHDFQDYDSREVTGYTGLVNQGATCYLNSLIQSLYFTSAFRNAVYAIPDSSGVTGGLQRIFYKLATSHPPVDTTDLTKAFGWDSADAFTQHDVQELARVLMDRLESKMKNTSVDGFLSKLFVGKMKSFVKCVNVPFESSRIEDFWDIQLNVKGMRDLKASFRDYCSTELLEGNNQYQAGDYGLQDACKGVVFESMPPVLHLQLKRYDFDWMRETEVKINDRFEFPLVLDVSEFVQTKGDWIYDLQGVLVHSGDLNAGHYYALLKPKANGDWFRFDDDRVTKAALHEVLDENFGGNEGPLLRRVTSAYMLVYIRRDSLDFVLPTEPSKVDPPAHIAAKVKEEQRAEELRLKVLHEQQQFISIRVLSEDTIKHHFGLGILPWTNPSNELEEPRNLKVRIGTPLKSLCRQLKAGKLWLAPSGPQIANARARPRKLQQIPLESGYTVDKLTSWADNTSPLIFAGSSPQNDDDILFFIKRFDEASANLKSDGTRWASPKNTLQETLLLDKGIWNVYLEVTERKSIGTDDSMLVKLDPAKAIGSQGLQSSDIILICKDGSQSEVLENYFNELPNRINLILMPFEYDACDVSSYSSKENEQGSNEEVRISINTNDSSEKIIAAISDATDIEISNLQLHSYPARWKRSVIVNSSGNNLKDLWEDSASDSVKVLYRNLPIPLSEYESLAEVSVTWLPEGTMGPEENKTLLAKPESLVPLDSLGSNKEKVVLWLAQYNRRVKEIDIMTMAELVEFQHQSYDIYAAPLAPLELAVRKSSSFKLVSCFHFHQSTLRAHSIPFQFAVIPNETFDQTKVRLLETLRRTHNNDRNLEKIKFTLVREKIVDPVFINDGKVVLFDMITSQDSLGLEHPERRRSVFYQQAIHID